MVRTPSWPVPIATLGASKGGTTAFRQGGKLHITCVLKSSFQFVPGAPMKSVDAEDLFCVESNHRNNPIFSVRATSDMAPYLPRVDVVMTGHAYTPAGHPVNRQPVRLAVFHNTPLLDKTLHVYGDHNGTEFQPFERIPLTYENAFGDIKDPVNPYGTGNEPGSRMPNIVDPRNIGIVAGFAPMSRGIMYRKRLRGSMSLAALEQPIADFPADFDWSYFQCAPLDQQLPSLVGNEWIVLEGIHPQVPRIASRLPSIRAIAVIMGMDSDEPAHACPIQLRTDILRIDANTLRCSVVSRCVVQLDDESAFPMVRIMGAVETEQARYAYLLTPPSAIKTRPFVSKSEIDSAKTVAFPTSADFEENRSSLQSVSRTLAPDSLRMRKMKVMPFAAESSQQRSPAPSIPIAGAPWSSNHAGSVPPVPAMQAMKMTMDLTPINLSEPIENAPVPLESLAEDAESISTDMPIPPALPVFEPVEARVAPGVVHQAEPSRDIWAQAFSEARVDPVKSAPAPLPPKPSVKNALYGAGSTKKRS